MTMTNSYATLGMFYARQGGTVGADAAKDAYMSKYLEDASRWIEDYCGREFYSYLDTLYFTANNGQRLDVDDLISVTSIALDVSGARLYDVSMSSTDYDLEPYNARRSTPPRPYTSLFITPNAQQWFPSAIRRGVKITGKWGFSDFTVPASSLSGDVNASVTTFPVTSGAAYSPGHVGSIGTEQVFIDSIATNNLTVRRGQNGTTAAAHLSGVALDVFDFGSIAEACLMQAARLWKRKDTMLGVSANTQLGPLMLKVPQDQDIRDLLDGFRRLV